MFKTNPHILRLSSAQALAGANSTVVYASGAIIGHTLAPSPELATLPISIFVAGMALSTLPMGAVARKHGRRVAFLVGNVCGVLMGLIAAYGLVQQSFLIFCLAMIFGGIYAAIVLTFRFAAAECVAPDKRPRALSTVMAGGVLAGVVGPQLANVTMNLWSPYVYAATYIGSAVVAVLSALVLAGIKFEYEVPQVKSEGRPLSEIVKQPRLIIAMLCGTISYMLMNFLMTSAPLAMEICGISRVDANWGIQWHLIGMYAPSFFTGRLITRFGARKVVLTGLVLLGMSAAVGYSGMAVAHFVSSLILLGIGWNFGFLGASALVLECHLPSERTKVQSLNDFVVFGMMFIGSFASGGLLSKYGWETVCLFAFPPLLLAAVAILRTSHTSAKAQSAT